MLLLVGAVAVAGAIFLALAVIAPEITAWPLPVALVLGLLTGTAGVVIADRKPRRRVPLIISAVAAILHGFGLLGVGAFVAHALFTAVEQRFIIPDGYMGEVAVIYNMADGVPEQRPTPRTITYDIPGSGLLVTKGQPVRGWQRNRYFYRTSEGSLAEIHAKWNTTIHDTTENRSDTSIGIYLAGGIGQSMGGGCSFEFTTFLVGTKTFMLDARRMLSISERMHKQGVSCRHAS